MARSSLGLQAARIVVLLGLLALAMPAQIALHRAFSSMLPPEPWGAWTLLMVIVMAFAAVMLVGRRDAGSAMLLTVEGTVAAAVAVIPPWLWLAWFGFGPIARVVTGGFTGSLLVQGLGSVWLAIVIATAARRWRQPAPVGGEREREAQPSG